MVDFVVMCSAGWLASSDNVIYVMFAVGAFCANTGPCMRLTDAASLTD
jgi:hypothetical protein